MVMSQIVYLSVYHEFEFCAWLLLHCSTSVREWERGREGGGEERITQVLGHVTFVILFWWTL